MREALIPEALVAALQQRGPEPGLLQHADRGVRYRAHDDQNRLTAAGIKSSMSRKGNCRDNAVMEPSFRRRKVALIYPEAYRTFEALRAHLFEYLEIFYNSRRRHSALGHLSPAQFEVLPNHTAVSTVCG